MTAASVALIRNMLGLIPLSVSITGRKRDLLIKILDPFFRRGVPESIRLSVGEIHINPANISERFIAYAFYNLLRHYRSSPLGRFILEQAGRRREGEIFFDIGANLGFYSLLAGQAGMRAIAIEPEPEHSCFLKRNHKLFEAVYPICLADGAGFLQFNLATDTNPGASSLIRGGDQDIYESHGSGNDFLRILCHGENLA